MKKADVIKVLKAEAIVINYIREQGETPDDFSPEDYIFKVCQCIKNPKIFKH